jgi:hypothetical protein
MTLKLILTPRPINNIISDFLFLWFKKDVNIKFINENQNGIENEK